MSVQVGSMHSLLPASAHGVKIPCYRRSAGFPCRNGCAMQSQPMDSGSRSLSMLHGGAQLLLLERMMVGGGCG